MARLPHPGSDSGQWGDILNEYLSHSHTPEGMLKDGIVGSRQIQDGCVDTSKLKDASVTAAKLSERSVGTNAIIDNSVSIQKISSIGEAGGVASLNPDGRLADSQVPQRLTEQNLDASYAPVDTGLNMLSWRAALANVDVAPATIVCIGDSITEHYGASAVNLRWPMRLARCLRQQYQPVGVTGGLGYISPCPKAGVPLFAWPGARSGGALAGNRGPKRLVFGLNGESDAITYTIKGTSIDILGYRQAVGNRVYSVSIDGASAVNHNVPDVVIGENYVERISLGSSGVHTVTIAQAWSQTYIYGIVVYDGDETTGIRVHECGWFGAAAATWMDGVSSDPQTRTFANDIALLNPDLIIISLGQNNQGLTTPEIYGQNMAYLVDHLQSLYRDFVHPNDMGMGLIANNLASIITPH